MFKAACTVQWVICELPTLPDDDYNNIVRLSAVFQGLTTRPEMESSEGSPTAPKAPQKEARERRFTQSLPWDRALARSQGKDM